MTSAASEAPTDVVDRGAQHPATLSALLRERTRDRHAHAESRAFVTDLMAGALSREAYLDLARQHLPIYSALEDAGRRLATDPVVAPFLLPELVRVPSLEADLAAAHGPAWRSEREVLPATAKYVAVLEAIDGAAGYLAHAYTRYLGDLSGGQIIARMLQRHYGMSSAELTFYTFARIPKPKPFKDGYRALLDAASLTEEEREACAGEAVRAFDLNAAMFGELGARHRAGSSGVR